MLDIPDYGSYECHPVVLIVQQLSPYLSKHK